MKKCVFYFITYFVVCFGGLGSLYRLVSLLMGESAFAWMPRMFEYHEQHPMQYIGIVAVSYALVAAMTLSSRLTLPLDYATICA